MDNFACLYVIRGEPYQPGTCINLNLNGTLIGRQSVQLQPDLAFSNPFISRQHFIIRREQDKAVLYDLGSRHGTEINGIRLTPHTPYPLNTFDIIKLAKGMTVLHFSYMFAEQTLELEPFSIARQLENPDQLTVNWEKRECVVEGKRIPMSEKEYLLIRVLHEHENRLVPLEEIKSRVWPERSPGAGGVPDVTLDELNTLIYRVRKKFGKDSFMISAVRGSGYMLETESNSTKAGVPT
ncbi:FHA domain-containing protein [Paenibacillus lycopersici]|uniref:FHA domain-containing protein n=1 Tax=Paenibacillus lycopersici TaxID=2704462 RepID=A0A6C0G0P9_9BACL|nr:FHA domain-containing protein [Paenibacillus lycopersici]QHT60964.1 FHA domain-containing protein [Paenibacillus lycopersici]